MELGLAMTTNDDELLKEWQDWGCGWVKDCFDLVGHEGGERVLGFSRADIDKTRERIRKARSYGIRTVVDVRCDSRMIYNLLPGQGIREPLTPDEQAEWDGADEVGKHRFARERSERVCRRICQQLEDFAWTLADEFKWICRDWEFWGENLTAACTLGSLAQLDYGVLLSSFYKGIKASDPDARVWTGGDGVSTDAAWLKYALYPPIAGPGQFQWHPQGVGGFFDVANWHHYTVKPMPGEADYGLAGTIENYDRVLSEGRRYLEGYGMHQPFCSTEWGLAQIDDAVLEAKGEDGLPLIKAYPYFPNWIAVPVSQGGDWLNGLFECFERHGFEVLCIHEWAEHPCAHRDHNFWGGYCGMIDIKGNKRPAWYVARDWARAHYGEAFQGV